MPISIVHRWFGGLKMHVVYLRDLDRKAYSTGIRSLGETRKAAVENLRRSVKELGADGILTYGNSIGGYGALSYGLKLGARSILGFGAATSMTPPLVPREQLRRRRLPIGPDLRPLFEEAETPLKTLLVYGEACSIDSRHAHNLANSSGISLHAPGLRAPRGRVVLRRPGPLRPFPGANGGIVMADAPSPGALSAQTCPSLLRGYNERPPHSKLGWLTPRAFAETLCGYPATPPNQGSDQRRTFVTAG